MKKCMIEAPETHSAGVYAIINTTKRKCYIGESADLKNRIKSHICLLNNGKHHIKAMQEDFDNGDKFIAEVIKETKNDVHFVGKHQRRMIESYYIACLLRLEIRLYNRSVAKQGENFFLFASSLDINVKNLKNKIIFSK